MEHIKAIGKGLLVIGSLAVIVGLIAVICMWPWFGLPPAIVFLAWVIGGGPNRL